MKAQFKFLSGARTGQVEAFRKHYIGLGRHPLSDVRFDADRDLDVSSRHAAILVKPEGFVLQDLGSKNGTFVNGKKVEHDTVLADGDVIGFGQKGPSVEFHILEADVPNTASASAEQAAGRSSNARAVMAAQRPTGAPDATPRRSSTAVRVAIEVARQTKQLRTTTKVLFGLLIVVAGGFGYLQWQGRRERSAELAAIMARYDSVTALYARTQARSEYVEQALHEAQAESARLRRLLEVGGGDQVSLRRQLDSAIARQRNLIGAAAVDYRGISQLNRLAVAMVLVEYSDNERFSGTAFAVDSQGTMITNKHVLVGEDGTRTPRRLGVIFSGSKQFFQARVLAVSDEADLGAIKVDISGGTPRIAGLASDPRALQQGDPVAIIGYPLGFDLPMDRVGTAPIAAPTLTAGTVSKVLSSLVQVDGYGAPGSSGSPIFDRDGRVVAVLYGGERESQGKIIYSVPANFVIDFLGKLGVRTN